MGLLCNCRATAEITDGAFAIGPINVGYSLDIEICPNCSLVGTFVNASFVISAPLLPNVNVSFTANASGIGFPVCENGVLTVDVDGTLVVDGVSTNVTVTLEIDSINQEVCITGLVLPVTLPCLAASVMFESCQWLIQVYESN